MAETQKQLADHGQIQDDHPKTLTTIETSLILFSPSVLLFLELKTIISFSECCRFFEKIIQEDINGEEHIFFWNAVNRICAIYYGLFLPDRVFYSKRHFFENLWLSRKKWATASGKDVPSNQQAFKIKVAVRFRPGACSTDNVSLPLHQFLKVKRSLLNSSDQGKILLGIPEREEFVDPLMGTLMKDPVLLKTSNRIVDRSVAVQCIVRGGRDPFNNMRLSAALLVPQDELKNEIEEFRKQQVNQDLSLELDKVKSIIEEGEIDPDLLEALIEAERLTSLSQRADSDSRVRNLSLFPQHTSLEPDVSIHEFENMDAFQQTVGQVVQPLADISEDIVSQAIRASNVCSDSTTQNEPSRNWKKTNESARVIELNKAKKVVSVNIPGSGIRPFYFSNVFDGASTQENVYAECAREAVTSCMNGYNACILCYGQTGSGKTHTQIGPDNILDMDYSDQDLPKLAGMTLRVCKEIMQAKHAMGLRGINVCISAQFVEIYEEQVIDLLSGNIVSIRRGSGDLVGAGEVQLDDLSTAVEVLRSGHAKKRFAATAMNDRSSRSHTAFVLQVTQTKEIVCGSENSTAMIKSQLHLVDLAGSERVKKSKVTGQRFSEAVGINASLLVLGKVIASLVESKRHVPYYESKLTTMLKAALGGNSKTTVIINCRPDEFFGDETLQSLRFGERCGMISNCTKVTASSMKEALETIDKALVSVKQQLQSLENRGMSKLESYYKLNTSYEQMKMKRKNLQIHLQSTIPNPPCCST